MSSVPEIVARSLAVARERSHGLKPSPEAVAWGKRQASTSPHWSDAKWSKIEAIFGVKLLVPDETEQQDQENAETMREVA